jgi:anti-sigma regulatory factor (Ser/Thr protein kinase)
MTSAAFPVGDPSHVASARRAAALSAVRAGFGETRAAQVALAVTELATNILKHAQAGEVLVTEIRCGDRRGLEILAIDAGRGIANLDTSMRDGESTAGSLGHGLGAVRRAADVFDVFSQAGKGSVVFARLWSLPGETCPPTGMALGAVSVAKPGEDVCGDAWTADPTRRRTTVLVVDGLGHGPLAADAAVVAVREFMRDPLRSPEAALEDLHAALRATRGAAVSIAAIDLDQEVVLFAGLGNVSGAIVSGDARRSLVSHNGTAGHAARKMQEFTYPLPKGSTLVLHSDGLGTHWDPKSYPGLWVRQPAVIAGTLYRDFTRRRDDVTVVVARRNDDERHMEETSHS